jgi:homoserine O-acetyltransferase
LASGGTIPACRIGFRTYGTLNARKSNAILFPTWFGGRSADLAGFIGPDRMADSSRFFVITVDALGNGVSCSPSNTPSMPRFTVADMVEAEYRLATEHFGLKHLHAVMGISMGGMQTFEWIVAHPDSMDLAVPIVGSTRLASIDLLLWGAELNALESAEKCRCDMAQAMKTARMFHTFAAQTPAYRTRETPPADYSKLVAQIEQSARTGLAAPDWAAQLRAMMAHDISLRYGGDMARAAQAVKAKVLVVVAAQDHMVNPAPAIDFARLAHLDLLELTSDCGHGAPSCEGPKMTEAVRSFLARERISAPQ